MLNSHPMRRTRFECTVSLALDALELRTHMRLVMTVHVLYMYMYCSSAKPCLAAGGGDSASYQCARVTHVQPKHKTCCSCCVNSEGLDKGILMCT